MNYSIPLYQPDLAGNAKAYVDDCFESGWISSKGKYVGQFEDGFAQRIGVAQAAAVCNGTAALHLALLSLGIGPGDEVIVPSFTYIASVNAITYTGATPVFVDSDPDTWQVAPSDVARKVSARTKAVMAVHLYGQSCELDALLAIARPHGIHLVEDCAEAFGTLYRGKHVGTYGSVATFSFYGNKTITTGEGGMVVTNDVDRIDQVRRLKGQGLAANREYWHDIIGYNYRMTNIAAAIGCAQLERADELIARKIRLAELYRESLQGLPVELHAELPHTRHSHWMITILVDSRNRSALRAHLAQSGIETRPTFPPVHTMPMYASTERLLVAEDLAARGINLPSWPGLSNEQVTLVTNAIREYFKHGQ